MTVGDGGCIESRVDDIGLSKVWSNGRALISMEKGTEMKEWYTLVQNSLDVTYAFTFDILFVMFISFCCTVEMLKYS